MKFPKEWSIHSNLEKELDYSVLDKHFEHDYLPIISEDDYSFGCMLNTNAANCIGYIAKNGIPILYGPHYNQLKESGLIK